MATRITLVAIFLAVFRYVNTTITNRSQPWVALLQPMWSSKLEPELVRTALAHPILRHQSDHQLSFHRSLILNLLQPLQYHTATPDPWKHVPAISQEGFSHLSDHHLPTEVWEHSVYWMIKIFGGIKNPSVREKNAHSRVCGIGEELT